MPTEVGVKVYADWLVGFGFRFGAVKTRINIWVSQLTPHATFTRDCSYLGCNNFLSSFIIIICLCSRNWTLKLSYTTYFNQGKVMIRVSKHLFQCLGHVNTVFKLRRSSWFSEEDDEKSWVKSHYVHIDVNLTKYQSISLNSLHVTIVLVCIKNKPSVLIFNSEWKYLLY